MNKIVDKKIFSENVVQLEVEAPLIAKAHRPGHFVILRALEKGERIPLTIVASDVERGTITMVVQKVGISTAKLVALNEGEMITDLVGPLGKATHIENVGTVLACGGGVGVAPLLPIVKGMKEAGNRVVSIIAARHKDLIILEEEIRRYSDEVLIMTDDGSYGEKGLITAGMDEIINREKVDLAIAIGPAIMMKFCAELTRKYNLPTVASLNAIMVDGTGMCGACRVVVGGRTRFTCIDGPEFDAHEVDFDNLMLRLRGI
ncbi:MAG: sulfide/dihydroorotate dehydrogenase-like FAD/NAD-binding protein [Culturomica sp.]|jgi:NAD(P)H-flavin reductase|nr:sulfide/dihydroorotate dehydrogenase-like FAD/NAD-binding protein [Culturomica sp.]